MKLYRTPEAVIAVRGEDAFVLEDFSMDALFASAEPDILLEDALRLAHPVDVPENGEIFLPPVGNRQEVWGTEGTVAYGERPVLFFKAEASGARGHLAEVELRKDATRCAPGAALTLAVNAAGRVFGFTIGNDLTARDLLEANSLYLPQAKFFRGGCALGPCLVLTDDFSPAGARARLSVERGGAEVFSGLAELARLAEGFANLTEWLSKTGNFTRGCLLMVDAGIAAPPDFALEPGDVARVSVDGIGELVNPVA